MNDFKKLELSEQVATVNNKLQEGKTVEQITSELGVGGKYISRTFIKNGYMYDRKQKLYIRTIENIIESATVITTTENTPVTNTTNKPNKQASEQPQANEYIKVLESRIESLEQQIQSINSVLNTITTNTTETTNNTNIKIKRFKGTDSSRSYRINNKVLEQWKAFCKAHSEYKVGDLIANALVEYMNKFK